MCPVGQAVDDRRGEPSVWEDRAPFAEGQVGGHGDRGPLIARGDDLEQQLSTPRVEMDIAELVQAEQVEPGIAGHRPREDPLISGLSAATTQSATFYVTFYQHASYGGSSLTASQPIDNLGVYGWNDAISSFKSLYSQRPKWWAHADYGIPSWHWPAGAEVSNVGSGANDTFSAVRNVP